MTEVASLRASPTERFAIVLLIRHPSIDPAEISQRCRAHAFTATCTHARHIQLIHTGARSWISLWLSSALDSRGVSGAENPFRRHSIGLIRPQSGHRRSSRSAQLPEFQR
jgi:hypothetical protein